MAKFIEADDIRVGDEVEGASNGFATRFRVAHIDNGRLYAAKPDGSHSPSGFLWAHECDWSLLDRPTPAVDLPIVPTLGWLTDQEGEFLTHAWLSQSEPGKAELEVGIYRPSHDEYTVAWMYPRQDEVTDFTPAVAVPRAALDDLRAYRGALDFDCATPAVRRIDTFLAAVDAASGDPR